MSFFDTDFRTVGIIIVGLAAVILIASLAVASLISRRREAGH